MDDASKIETYKAGLRFTYSTDVPGLKSLIAALMSGEASNAVVITAHNFADAGSSGTLVLEPMAKLAAALEVLGELDPASAPPVPSHAYVRFSAGSIH